MGSACVSFQRTLTDEVKTMKRVICFECKKESVVQKSGDYETTYIDRDGESRPLLVPNVTWLECEECGDVTLDHRAMSAIESARREALGLLTPAEIRNFRLRLRKTQMAMSELLGVGEKTLCRWESGSFQQSEAFDRYLRLVMADESILYTLQQIVEAKRDPSPSQALEDLRRTFCFIKDIGMVAGRSEDFVALFEQGLLHATPV